MNCEASSSDTAMCRDARLGTSPALAKPHHILHPANSIRPTKTKHLTKWVFVILAPWAVGRAVLSATRNGRDWVTSPGALRTVRPTSHVSGKPASHPSATSLAYITKFGRGWRHPWEHKCHLRCVSGECPVWVWGRSDVDRATR